MIDKYLIQSKRELSEADIEKLNFDLFISVYNESERVLHTSNKINAKEKLIVTNIKYDYLSDIPDKIIKIDDKLNELEYIERIISLVDQCLNETSKVCIDITGFLRPDLIYLVKYFKDSVINNISFIYTEPQRYIDKEATKFSDSFIEEVCEVEGYYISPNVETDKDILIIGTGYDPEEIRHVSDKKDKAFIYQIFGLPSLSLDMYQENRLSAYDALDYMEQTRGIESNYFSPAYDPFETAQTIDRIIKEFKKINSDFTNLYLSALGSKPQVLGFALYYLDNFVNKNAGFIFPYYNTYKTNICKGVNRLWLYDVEFKM